MNFGREAVVRHPVDGQPLPAAFPCLMGLIRNIGWSWPSAVRDSAGLF
jgi:hypothetical protein